jgi:hypothetical protein
LCKRGDRHFDPTLVADLSISIVNRTYEAAITLKILFRFKPLNIIAFIAYKAFTVHKYFIGWGSHPVRTLL